MKWFCIFILFLAVGCVKKSERSTEPPPEQVWFVCAECGWEKSRLQHGSMVPDICSGCKNDSRQREMARWQGAEVPLPLVMKKAKDDDGMPHAED